MNRRHFLAGSAAVAGVPFSSAAGAPAATGFHLGAVTYNLFRDADLETTIRMLEDAGFEGVELRTTHKHGVEPGIGPEERTRVRQRFERSKVRLVSYGTTVEFHSPDAAERARQIQTGKQFVDLAADTGCVGIKVRPNGFPKGVPREQTIRTIGEGLREVADYGAKKSIQVWMEVHATGTNSPPVCEQIMKVANHPNALICWNSNDEDIVNGSVKPSFDLLKPWIKHVHINELSKPYPWRELFGLLRSIDYRGYTLAEVAESKEPERFLKWYKALWTELCRPCG
jgi:sugar phosphate isomerase/epimerase